MPNVAIYNISGAKVGEMELSISCAAGFPPSLWRAVRKYL